MPSPHLHRRSSDASSLLAFEGAARLDDLAEEDKSPLQPAQFALHFQTVPGKSYGIEFAETLEATGEEWLE